ncbi:MAG: FadR family transcriptional regulator [Desulfobacterales bacterium]|jgi:GntR family transcriptional repressor for pyruvate dehydrogenase complex|nr:FadR family transcriptional regulator [Desulfobacterales bacterium]
MAFETIRRNTAPEMVVAQILKKIASGEILTGSRLPSQQELALSFGVGRSTIREALNALAVMGYLDVQQGRGTFVSKELPGEDPSVVKLKTAFQAASLLDIIELRETLECRAAELAAERIDAGQIKRLRQSLRDMQKDIDDYDGFLKADLAFHMVIAEATANPIYSKMLRFLLEKVVEHHNRFKTSLLSTDYRAHSIRTFERILACLEREDGPQAAESMRDHLNAIRQELKDIL